MSYIQEYMAIGWIARGSKPSAGMNYCSIMEGSLPAGLNQPGKTNNLAPKSDLFLHYSRNSCNLAQIFVSPLLAPYSIRIQVS